jgi:hypothetical protein
MPRTPARCKHMMRSAAIMPEAPRLRQNMFGSQATTKTLHSLVSCCLQGCKVMIKASCSTCLACWSFVKVCWRVSCALGSACRTVLKIVTPVSLLKAQEGYPAHVCPSVMTIHTCRLAQHSYVL